MRTLHDPVTAAVVASTALQAGGQIASSQQAAAQREAQADFRRVEAAQEEVARNRELEALEREQERVLARTRASLAAQGAGPQGAQSQAIQGSQAAQFGQKRQRTRQDSENRQANLLARASNQEDAADAERAAGFFKAAGTLASGGQTLLQRNQGQ